MNFCLSLPISTPCLSAPAKPLHAGAAAEQPPSAHHAGQDGRQCKLLLLDIRYTAWRHGLNSGRRSCSLRWAQCLSDNFKTRTEHARVCPKRQEHARRDRITSQSTSRRRLTQTRVFDIRPEHVACGGRVHSTCNNSSRGPQLHISTGVSQFTPS